MRFNLVELTNKVAVMHPPLLQFWVVPPVVFDGMRRRQPRVRQRRERELRRRRLRLWRHLQGLLLYRLLGKSNVNYLLTTLTHLSGIPGREQRRRFGTWIPLSLEQ